MRALLQSARQSLSRPAPRGRGRTLRTPAWQAALPKPWSMPGCRGRGSQCAAWGRVRVTRCGVWPARGPLGPAGRGGKRPAICTRRPWGSGRARRAAGRCWGATSSPGRLACGSLGRRAGLVPPRAAQRRPPCALAPPEGALSAGAGSGPCSCPAEGEPRCGVPRPLGRCAVLLCARPGRLREGPAPPPGPGSVEPSGQPPSRAAPLPVGAVGGAPLARRHGALLARAPCP